MRKQVSPCGGCGAYGADGNYGEHVARYVSFGPGYRLLSFLAGRAQPQNYWEYK